MPMKLLTGIAPVIATVLLAGCSGAPGEADIRKALERTYQSNPGMTMVGFELRSVEVLGCEPSGKAWQCDVTVQTNSKLAGQQKSTGPIRLLKGDAGWVVSR